METGEMGGDFRGDFNKRGSSGSKENFQGIGRDKLSAYGKEGLAPLLNLLTRYGDDIIHYVRHVAEGLESASESLTAINTENPTTGNQDVGELNCEKRKLTADWFKEGATWAKKLETQIKSSSSEEILEFIEREGRAHPAALFASSLIAGSIFGAVGKEAYKLRPGAESEDVGQRYS